MTTDRGQLWKYSPPNEGGTCSWKIVSFKRFNRIACNRGHYAGLIDGSPSYPSPFLVFTFNLLFFFL